MKIIKVIFNSPIHLFFIPLLFQLKFFIDNYYLFNNSELTIIFLAPIVILIPIILFRNSYNSKLLLVISILLIPLCIPGLVTRIGYASFLIFSIVSYFIFRSKTHNPPHLPLNVFIFFALSFQLVGLFNVYIDRLDFKANFVLTMNSKPNIYHIVLDGYSNNHGLNTFYAFDNSKFTKNLKGLGFNIYSDATSPYNQTLPIISSIFNMEYSITDATSNRFLPPKSIMSAWGASPYGGIVADLLKSNGYNFTFTPSGYGFLKFPDNISTSKKDLKSHITKNYFITEYLNSLWWYKNLHTPNNKELYKTTIEAFLDHSYIKSKKPIFYYSHILSPHPPFDIDIKGDFTQKYSNFSSINDGSHSTKMDKDLIKEYKSGYVEKIKFSNEYIINKVNNIINNDSNNKIIIVQGDHGGGSEYSQESLESSCLQERYKPLLAIYSDYKLESSEENYTLVNIYRDIFTVLSNQNFEKLETKTYYLPWGLPEKITPINIVTQGTCPYKT